jgi:hypothetical protein
MSASPTALTALEHDTARRLDPLDRGRLLRDRAITVAAAVAADEPPPAAGDPVAPTGSAPFPPRDPALEALERTCLTVKRIAHDIGMPRATLEAYRLGTRRMPHAARVRLGTYLAAHAAMLDGLARQLMSPISPTALPGLSEGSL